MEEYMKKIVFFVCLVFSFACFAQAPDFNLDAENAFVLDANSIAGKAREDVRLINETDEQLGFEVYYYDNKNNSWQFYGRAFLKGFYDSEDVDSRMEDRIAQIQYFAVVPKNNKVYNYRAQKIDNDLCIFVMPDSEFDFEKELESAFVIDSDNIKGRFYDEIEFVNLTDDYGISFVVYASDYKDKGWKKAGGVTLQEYNDSEDLESPIEKTLRNFRYFAIVSKNGKNYSFEARKQKGDLVIFVRN